MPTEQLQNFDTFVGLTGSLGQRIKMATGLQDERALMTKMEEKPVGVAKDLLVPNICSQDCPACYFKERVSNPNIAINSKRIDDIRKIADVLSREDKDLVYFYPREITTGIEMLEFYPQFGQDRVLSNGKLLHYPGIIEKMKNSGIKRISITLPGSRETYMEYTGEKSENYDQLQKNIQMAANSGLEVSVYMPIYKSNLDEVLSTAQKAVELGVKNVDFIRMSPKGSGVDIEASKFIYGDDIVKFMRNLNNARHVLGDKINLNLFRGSWGPNFYQKNIFQYLAGPDSVYPKSKYYCPAINGQYLGVMVESNKVYRCFQGVSFKEFEIGTFSIEDGVKIEKEVDGLNSEWLHKNLRGICSADNCEEHNLCLGGCRSNAYSWAVLGGDPEPMSAGQDFCMTNFIRNLKK